MAIALILAAGRGERLGANRPKALVELGGRPLLHWSAGLLAGMAEIEQIVLALPPEMPALADLPQGVQAPAGTIGVPGGAVRSESVKLALAAAGDARRVLVHDAARPLLSAELVRSTLAALDQPDVDAAIAAAPVTDTIKRADERLRVAETLDRSGLWAIQTPQAFERYALERALDVPSEVLAQATDDAWLIERAGGRVAIVPAPAENIKVTTPLDLELAALLLARRADRR